MKVTHYSPTGEKGSTKLSTEIFGVEANPILISQAVRVYLSNLRQGTSKVKTRSEVNRTKKKWFKQKGTGNARHGARTPNIFVGGGVSHGPTGGQNWTKDLSPRMKRTALVSALVAQAESIIVHEGLAKVAGKTVAAAKLLKAVQAPETGILVVVGSKQLDIVRAVQNIQNVTVTSGQRLTALNVAQANVILMSSEAVGEVEARLVSKAKKVMAKLPKSEAKAEVKTEIKAAKPKATKTETKPAAKAAPKKAAAAKATKPKAKAK